MVDKTNKNESPISQKFISDFFIAYSITTSSVLTTLSSDLSIRKFHILSTMIRLALVDDHNMFRAGLRAILDDVQDIEVILESKNGKEFLDNFHEDVDIILMDLDMPGLNGMQTMEALHRKKSGANVIFVSSNKEPALIGNLMELGARGYLHKEAEKQELIDAIYSVNDSGYYFNDLVSQSMLVKLAGKEQISPKFNQVEQLSEREKEVLDLICEELTTAEIADKLFISPKTVENHRSRIMDKTGSRNIAGLVVYAIKNKLVNVG